MSSLGVESPGNKRRRFISSKNDVPGVFWRHKPAHACTYSSVRERYVKMSAGCKHGQQRHRNFLAGVVYIYGFSSRQPQRPARQQRVRHRALSKTKRKQETREKTCPEKQGSSNLRAISDSHMNNIQLAATTGNV